MPPLPGVKDFAAPGAVRTAALRYGNAFAAAYRAGSTMPEEVAERFLDAVAASDHADPPLRAFIAIDAADLRGRRLRAATLRYREGRPLGPLDGVPVAVKDELDQAPYPTTAGTSFLGRAPGGADATAVGAAAGGGRAAGRQDQHAGGGDRA